MKTLRLVILCISLFYFSNASKGQWVDVPLTGIYMYILGSYPSCMQQVNGTQWQLDTTCTDIVSMKVLYLNNAGLTSLDGIQYFDSLEELSCNKNAIAHITQLPARLKVLACEENGLQSIAYLPPGLEDISCTFNNLTSLPVLPVGLKYLECSWNNITILPLLPGTLEWLRCFDNQLTNLPTLPNGLTYLQCGSNLLTTLPVLPNTLGSLECYSNNLGSLPVLPVGLDFLDCSGNNISSLPAVLPPNLFYLSISENPIPTIPPLPNGLVRLYCSHTPITVLPQLPNSIAWLMCDGTGITIMPQLPPSMEFLDVSQTAITCLPRMNMVRKLYFDSTGITCLPNYPLSNTLSSPPLNTVPLCDFYNNNGCEFYGNINGKVYEDLNGNCQYDTTDRIFDEVKLQLWQGGNLIEQTTAYGGNYLFDTHSFATYQITVDTLSSPFRMRCPAGGSLTSVISAADSMDFNMDFALECKPGYDLEARSIFGGVFRPANITYVDIGAGDASNFYNSHCAAGVSGNVTLTLSGPVQYLAPANSALTPMVSGNTLTWNIADFGTVNFFSAFDILVRTDTFAQANQQVCFALTLNPIAGDNVPANNTLIQCFNVVNSYDPNDKQVYPHGNIDTSQRELTYTIRFQNTGNAEAQHIYITDTLSASINPASFQLLAYSHQPMVQIDGNKARFNYANINLPDSTSNEPGSHGYIQYKVRLKDNLPVGTTINNTAYIYFDFNAPVVTNTTTNTIYIPPVVVKPKSIGKYRIQGRVMPNGKL